EAGREMELAQLLPASQRKRVMVVGGGPAGMEAARVAALRGHLVSLYEKGQELGAGQLSLAAVSPQKEKLRWVKEDLETQVRQLPIELHLGTEVDRETAEKVAPDVLVVASGARPLVPSLPGLEKMPFAPAHDVLAGRAKPTGQKVVVLGGWQTGCETAEYLAHQGYQVTIVARSNREQMAGDAIPANRAALFARLGLLKVNILAGHDVRQVEPHGLRLVDREGKESFLEADYLVLARGVVPQREWAEGLEGRIKEVYFIGDCAQPATIAEALLQGTIVARRI
ncbi:MAG: FAD-dependent oxidoreductase, partial [Chloroflexota bacterium]